MSLGETFRFFFVVGLIIGVVILIVENAAI